MWRRVLGGCLFVIGVLGFLTIADDLRHTGELFGVGAVMVAGAALFVSPAVRRVALQWLALGLLVGAAVGAGVDRTRAGVVLGAAVGLFLAFATGKRPS